MSDPLPVLGNSLGGAVAMAFAAAHPDRVSSLVLIDSAGFGKEVTLALRLLSIRPVGEALLRPTLKNARRTIDGIFYNKDFATDARIIHQYAVSSRPAHARTLLDLATELGTFRGIRDGWRKQLLDDVAKLGIATLVAWGDHDHVLPPSHLNAAARAFPDAQTHLFADAGHMPQIEQPDEFAAVVERFLATASSAPDRESAAL